jgi:hypothetical protein
MIISILFVISGPFKLVKELFQEVKPGLSYYADNPKKVY